MTTTPLADLRKAAGVPQTTLGKTMGVAQTRVSAIEKTAPDSAQVSTLRAYVEALGGELEVNVSVDGHKFRVA